MAICHLQSTCVGGSGKVTPPPQLSSAQKGLLNPLPCGLETFPQLLPPGPRGQTHIIQAQPRCFLTSRFRSWLQPGPELPGLG